MTKKYPMARSRVCECDTAGVPRRARHIACSVGLLLAASCASATNLEWVRQFGGNHWVEPDAICLDDSGNGYVTGTFIGVADFDPGPGTYNLTADGGNNAFVCKLDASGSLLWATNSMGLSVQRISGIAVDTTNHVYLTGYSDTDSKREPAQWIPPDFYDMFVAKLAPDGGVMWTCGIAGQSGDTISGIAVGDSGNIVVAGSFNHTRDLDPGLGVHNVTSAGSDDVFVCMLDATGALVYAVQLGGPGSERDARVTLTPAGEVVCSGSFSNVVDFDPASGVVELSSAGYTDVFVCKLDAGGALLWAKQMGGIDFDCGMDVAVDESGNVYTTGALYGPGDFDPGAGTCELTPDVGNAVFVSKLDANGEHRWAKCFANTGHDFPARIAVDGIGNVYSMGTFHGSTNLDPGGTYAVSSWGSYDVYIAMLNSNGVFRGAAVVGGPAADVGCGLAVNAENSIWSAGWFSGTADFDPGSGTVNLVATSDEFNGFAMKLNGMAAMPLFDVWGLEILVVALVLLSARRKRFRLL